MALRDANGEMIGLEIRIIDQGAKLRMIYRTGTVSHNIPNRLLEEITGGSEVFVEMLAGQKRVAQFGQWIGT